MADTAPSEKHLRDAIKAVASDLRQHEARGAKGGEWPDAAVKGIADAARRLEDALDPSRVVVPTTGGPTGASGPARPVGPVALPWLSRFTRAPGRGILNPFGSRVEHQGDAG